MDVTFVGYSWNNQGIFLYSIFLEHYLGIFPGISQGTFSEYSGNTSWNVQRIFHKHAFAQWVQLLIPEKTKLFGSTKSKITKDKNGEAVSHLEITDVVLIHCNIVNNDYH